MIKSISISNFRSIKDLVKLNLVRSKRKKSDLPNYAEVGHTELSLSTVIYGANASGKSNVLRAFKALEFLVLKSANFQVGDSLLPYEPFKLIKGYEKKPVFFELEFYIDKVLYRYAVAFNAKEIELERLDFYPNPRKLANLFYREKGKEMQFGEYFKGEKRIIERLTLPNQLFLSKAAENNAESILPVFQLFRNKLRVYLSLEPYETNLKQFYAKRLAEEPDSSFTKKLNALVCALDTGINAVTAKETDWDSLRLPENVPDSIRKEIQATFKYEIRTVHEHFNENNEKLGLIDFDIEDESSGTKSLLSLGGIIIDALEKGSVLVIDEFEKNLHPLITSYLIKLFNDKLFNPKNAQLIFATHDVTQLKEDIFNRDQVWFTQKNEYGVTELIRCSDIKGLRLNVPLDKWYMTGRLGGTAIINDSDFILAMQENFGE